MKKKKRNFFYKSALGGGVFGVSAIVMAAAALAFTEPTDFSAITEPTSGDSSGGIETAIGTPESVQVGTNTIFGYLRTVHTNVGGTPVSVAPNASNVGKIGNLTGTSADAADTKTIFNYIKKINESLDFPSVSSVLSSDTVKGNSGTIASVGQQIITPSTSNQTITQGYHSGTGYCAGDADLIADNIKSGVNMFGIAGTIAASNCSSEGQQNCVASGSYYAGTSKSLNSWTTNYSAGYYPAFNLTTVDSTLAAGNIKSGRSIFGISGTVVPKTSSCDSFSDNKMCEGGSYIDYEQDIRDYNHCLKMCEGYASTCCWYDDEGSFRTCYFYSGSTYLSSHVVDSWDTSKATLCHPQ